MEPNDTPLSSPKSADSPPSVPIPRPPLKHTPTPRTPYEVDSRWDDILSDLSLYSSMLGMHLLCTTGTIDRSSTGAHRITIRFPLQRQVHYTALRESEELAESLNQYFFEVLSQPAVVEMIQERTDDSHAVSRYENKRMELRSDGLYQIDLKNEPLLRRIQELFETVHLDSEHLPPPPHHTPGDDNEHPEDDERHAEDAE